MWYCNPCKATRPQDCWCGIRSSPIEIAARRRASGEMMKPYTLREFIDLLGAAHPARKEFAALEAELARCIEEKSVMLKAMEDARRAMAYSYKFDPVMEIAYLKLDNSICAVKPTKEG